MTVAEHKAAAPQSVRCFVLTVSDTRTDDTDTSGRAIADLLTAAGHVVAGRAIVKDDPDAGARARSSGSWRPRRAGDHHDRRHRHHVARQHVRSGQRAAREAARRVRRAVPHAQLPGDRLGRDDEPRQRRPGRRPHRRRAAGIGSGRAAGDGEAASSRSSAISCSRPGSR